MQKPNRKLLGKSHMAGKNQRKIIKKALYQDALEFLQEDI